MGDEKKGSAPTRHRLCLGSAAPPGRMAHPWLGTMCAVVDGPGKTHAFPRLPPLPSSLLTHPPPPPSPSSNHLLLLLSTKTAPPTRAHPHTSHPPPPSLPQNSCSSVTPWTAPSRRPTSPPRDLRIETFPSIRPSHNRVVGLPPLLHPVRPYRGHSASYSPPSPSSPPRVLDSSSHIASTLILARNTHSVVAIQTPRPRRAAAASPRAHRATPAPLSFRSPPPSSPPLSSAPPPPHVGRSHACTRVLPSVSLILSRRPQRPLPRRRPSQSLPPVAVFRIDSGCE